MGAHCCLFLVFKQKKESLKKTQDEEIKHIGEERTKQIYKSWKEDSEWQASCEYPPEASGSRLAPTIKWPIQKAFKEVMERSVFYHRIIPERLKSHLLNSRKVLNSSCTIQIMMCLCDRVVYSY